MKPLFELQQQHKKLIKESTVNHRLQKLKLLETAVMDYRDKFKAALYKDLRKSDVETDLTEIYPVLSEIRFIRKRLRSWMKDRNVPTPIALFGSSSKVRYEPKGNVLIISPWNYPVNLSLVPLAGAIAAGNTVILKPSEISSNTSAVLKNMIEEYFSPEELSVLEGDASTAKRLLEMPFDHIFFTGNTAVGKIVMAAAANNLASVTLELGGKSPTIVDETANIRMAASRIVWSKFLNDGQTCIAPDYILVHEKVKSILIDNLKKQLLEAYGEEMMSSEFLVRIVNKKHFKRLDSLLENAVSRGACINFGGKKNESEKFLEPTIISNIDIDSDIMKEEIFGPLLPIISYSNLGEAIRIINERDKPLSLYIYSKSKRNINQILSQTSSGGVSVNHSVLHFLNQNLPFGGVNSSGIGKHHGKYSFLCFSNEKAILNQWSPISPAELIRAPYSGVMKKLTNFLVKWL